MEDPRQHHFLEGTASARVRHLIEHEARAVWDERSAPGAGGPLLCLSTANAWYRRFEAAGIAVQQQGRTSPLGRRELGGYLVPGEQEPRDHFWLVVGEELALFDPTYGQFRRYGPPSLANYITDDGVPFETWRCGSRDMGHL